MNRSSRSDTRSHSSPWTTAPCSPLPAPSRAPRPRRVSYRPCQTRQAPPATPLRVAIVGSGPSAFYAAEHLQKQVPGVEVDMFDRLPTPYGLVRGGVAPDHQKIKSVTKVYDRLAAQPGFRFLGNVEVGRDLSREELRRCYDAVIYAVGAPSDRALGVPGEDLAGSHPATEFVAWYNGHPDFADCSFDLSAESVVVDRHGQRRGGRGAGPGPHPGGAGQDRHRPLRPRGAGEEPGQGHLDDRPPGSGAGRLHQSRGQGAGRDAGSRRRRAARRDRARSRQCRRGGRDRRSHHRTEPGHPARHGGAGRDRQAEAGPHPVPPLPDGDRRTGPGRERHAGPQPPGRRRRLAT